MATVRYLIVLLLSALGGLGMGWLTLETRWYPILCAVLVCVVTSPFLAVWLCKILRVDE